MKRLTRPALVAAIVALAILAGVGGWAWLQAGTPCEDLPREDLSLGEMAALHRRVEAYKQSTEGAALQLSAREASFLVREQLDLPAWLAIRGTDLAVEARVTRSGRCWNVGFQGSVQFEGGTPFIATDDLRVGRLDLGWAVRGWRFGLPRSWLATGDAQVDDLVNHLVSVEVTDGQLAVQLDDPEAIR